MALEGYHYDNLDEKEIKEMCKLLLLCTRCSNKRSNQEKRKKKVRACVTMAVIPNNHQDELDNSELFRERRHAEEHNHGSGSLQWPQHVAE